MNSLIKKISSKSGLEIILMNALLIAFLIFVLAFSPFSISSEWLFYSTDSKTYFNAGSEFFQLNQTGDSIIRPFLYSVFLFVSFKIGGVYLVVILQAMMWIISANLLFQGVSKFSNNKLLGYLALLAFISNISLITYIYHGLTEIVTVFLLAIVVYVLLKNFRNSLMVKTWLIVVLLLSLLTVVKPVFQYPTLGIILLGAIYFWKDLIARKKNTLKLLAVSIPLLLQVSVMYYKYGLMKVSTIDVLTIRTYFVAKGIRTINQVEDIEESKKIALDMSDKEVNEFILNNRGYFLYQLRREIKNNILAPDATFIVPEGYKIEGYGKYMITYYQNLYAFSCWFLVLFIVVSLIDLFRKKIIPHICMYVIGLILYYVTVTSGISYWQGDRLIIFTLPLWIALYAIILNRMTKFIPVIINLFTKKIESNT